jgi:transcriptional regulator with XRE-family HTH domain
MMGKQIGQLIQEYRKRSKLTLSQLATALKNRNCIFDDPAKIGKWESGLQQPEIEIIKALAIIFKLNEIEKADFFEAAGYPINHELPLPHQQDERILRDGESIFSEADLRELINTIYAGYRYYGIQFDKLVQLINFLGLESNRLVRPELANETKRLCAYLDTFQDFLTSNFQQEKHPENGEITYLFQTPETSYETESFLIEFQMVSMDVENAYRKYRAAVSSTI